MNSVTVFIENLSGDLGTNAWLSSNKFDGVDQSKTAVGFNFKDLMPSYRAPLTPDKQQDTGPALEADPKSVSNDVINGQQAIARKYRNEVPPMQGNIVSRLYNNKSDDQGTMKGDDIASRLRK